MGGGLDGCAGRSRSPPRQDKKGPPLRQAASGPRCTEIGGPAHFGSECRWGSTQECAEGPSCLDRLPLENVKTKGGTVASPSTRARGTTFGTGEGQILPTRDEPTLLYANQRVTT